MRLSLGLDSRNGALTVTNDDAVKINFQMQLKSWTQDENGNDVYQESKDLIFFPRLMSLEPKTSRVIRVSAPGVPGTVEKTYRLFIEELPDLAAAKDAGTQIAVRFRFAVPVFVIPIAASKQGEILSTDQHDNAVVFKLKNTGNTHFKIESISLRANDQDAEEIIGGYVLAGVTREFKAPISPKLCRSGEPIPLLLKGEGIEIKQMIKIDPSRCKR